MFKLVIQDDEGKTTVVPLIRDEITIGRKEGNTIRLTERNVSRRHARILRNNGEVSIEDLGSYNGIRVNNARIAERVALRVSDQVQIGDYKLYLKAEGVEQVDDARTMPIERVDSAGGAPTDVIPVVAAAAPTAPVPIPHVPTPVPGQLPPNTKLVGSPTHTLVAVADTDPQGRPVASAAAIAAITAQPGYGRMVVLSSNFAGKEFELSRPQMIVGRTDENDLVVNHRSISRNHAKIVREPDTGRYTISDLQSSNGVRVNGQDYGKVELRRGDVIDLGHVRLRFIEPGEDFVFSRDAVITDVPEAGSKKGVFIFVALAVLVLGFAVIWMVKGGGGEENVVRGGDAGTSRITLVDAQPIIELDGPLVAVLPEAGPDPVPGFDKKKEEELSIDCKKAIEAQDWIALSDCAGQLKTLGSPLAQEFSDRAGREGKNQAHLRNLITAIKAGDLATARKLELQIGDSSTYTPTAHKAVDDKERELTTNLTRDLTRAVQNKDCGKYERLSGEYQKYGGTIVTQARTKAGRCVERPDPPKTCPEVACAAGLDCKDGKCVKPPAPQCNFAALKKDGEDQATAGNPAGALVAFEKALACQYDGNTASRAFLAACLSKNESRARALWPKIPASSRTLKKRCVDYGMNPDWFPQ